VSGFVPSAFFPVGAPPGAPAGVVTPPAATSEAVAFGGSVTSWTFGAFTDPDSRIASYSATLVTVTGSGSLSGTGLGPYSITGTGDGDAYTVELDALDGDGGVLATAVHTVTIVGEGLADPAYTAPSAGDYIIGGYHDFDGTDEQIAFGAISSLEFDATDTFTISFWVYKDQTGSGAVVLSYNYGTAATSNGEGWFINYTNSTLLFGTGEGGVTNSRAIADPTTDTWHHVVFVFAAGTFTAYLNGSSASITSSSGTLFDNITYANVTNVRIGTIEAGLAYFPGYIAEVGIWGSDQSANVAAIYNSRARHNLMDLTTPPDLFYAPLTIQGDDPGSGGSVAELVANNDGSGVNMETADAVIPAPTTVTSTLTKALDVATSVVTTTKVEDVESGGPAGTGSSFP